jgi:hypothetical protein
VVVAVKQAALRGLVTGLLLSAFVLAIPLSFKAGVQVAQYIDPPVFRVNMR